MVASVDRCRDSMVHSQPGDWLCRWRSHPFWVGIGSAASLAKGISMIEPTTKDQTVPVISIVGRSNSGKTTLLEKLIPELKRRGYRVATVKHHSHPGIEFDQPGKDTWRHAQAGSDYVVIAALDRIASIRRVEREPTLDEIVASIRDVDIILTEGYKQTGKHKVEVVRAERSTQPLCSPDELLALVTDIDALYPVSRFGLDDAAGLADLIETLM